MPCSSRSFVVLSRRAGRDTNTRKRRRTPMLRIAVIGAGRIGHIHAHNIAAHARATLVGIADPDTDAVIRLAGDCGTDVLTVEEVFAAKPGGAEAVLIASPTPTHADYIERA